MFWNCWKLSNITYLVTYLVRVFMPPVGGGSNFCQAGWGGFWVKRFLGWNWNFMKFPWWEPTPNALNSRNSYTENDNLVGWGVKWSPYCLKFFTEIKNGTRILKKNAFFLGQLWIKSFETEILKISHGVFPNFWSRIYIEKFQPKIILPFCLFINFIIQRKSISSYSSKY